MSLKTPQPIGLKSALIALMISVIWGGNIVSIRVGVDSVPPMWSAFWRMLAGVVIVLFWSLRQRVGLRAGPGETGPLLILGVLFTAQIGLLNAASPLTSPAYGVVILNSYPIFANLCGHIAARYAKGRISEEPLTPVRTAGLALALAGVAWLALAKPDPSLAPRPLLGNLLMVSSSFLLGIRQVYTRWLVQKVEPVRSVLWQMLVSLPLFLSAAILTEPMVYGFLTAEAVVAISYQGVLVAGLCFILWARLLQKHSAGTLSMFAFLVPFFGIALSTRVFHEALNPGLFAGAALVLTGVFVVIRLGQSGPA